MEVCPCLDALCSALRPFCNREKSKDDIGK